VAAAIGGRGPREEGLQQLRLSRGGVLVLVEQHDPELGAQRRRHLGHLAGEPGGDRHLVGELDRAALAFQLLVGLGEADELDPLPRAGRGVPQRGVHLPPVVERRRQRLGDERRRLGPHGVRRGEV